MLSGTALRTGQRQQQLRLSSENELREQGHVHRQGQDQAQGGLSGDHLKVNMTSQVRQHLSPLQNRLLTSRPS